LAILEHDELPVVEPIPVGLRPPTPGEVDDRDVVRRNLTFLAVYAGGKAHATQVNQLTCQALTRPQCERRVLLG
jgi:hypothetical protein